MEKLFYWKQELGTGPWKAVYSTTATSTVAQRPLPMRKKHNQPISRLVQPSLPKFCNKSSELKQQVHVIIQSKHMFVYKHFVF